MRVIIGLVVVFGIVGLLCVVGVVNQPASPQSPPPEPTAEDRAENARQMAQEREARDEADALKMVSAAKTAVREKLKAPSTAQFPLEDIKVVPYGYNQWMVGGNVDAQNSFGVMLRQDWAALMTKSADGWSAVYLELADDKWGEMPRPSPFPARQLTPVEIAALKAKEAKRLSAGVASTLKWNQDQATAGDAYGELRMGERYRDGDGVEKDLSKAREMFQKSSAQGNQEAVDALKKLPLN